LSFNSWQVLRLQRHSELFINLLKIHEACNVLEKFLTAESNTLHGGCTVSTMFLTVETIMLHEGSSKSESFLRAESMLHQNCVVRMNQIPETKTHTHKKKPYFLVNS